MKLYVGITDSDWFRFLRSNNAVEMNFWRPRSTANFKAIQPNEIFLFKLKAPANKIVGGAFFVRHTVLPLEMAWDVFGEANGCSSLSAFRQKILSIRGDTDRNPNIGCTVLTDPFYLPDGGFWPAPSDWPGNTMMGKVYDATHEEGATLFTQAKELLQTGGQGMIGREEGPRYGNEILIRPRLGQGGFRVLVMDNYTRRCAITGERTLPVLEAAHIQPFSESGPHDPSNGLLLRSDLHTLFDRGYLTVTNDFRVEVSPRIKQEFSNGREYYAHHGRKLMSLPHDQNVQPNQLFLEWHQNNRYLRN